MTEIEIFVRLLAATIVGMVIGINRDLKGKPSGVRTLGLVSLGTAIVAVTALHIEGLQGDPNAISRVAQGTIQGVLGGIGFIGAGVVLRRPDLLSVKNLTTAATVWISACIGLACGFASWRLVAVGLAMTFLLLFFGGPVERWVERLLGIHRAEEEHEDA